MESDIVARLRWMESVPTMLGFHGISEAMIKAADEIEWLRARVVELEHENGGRKP